MNIFRGWRGYRIRIPTNRKSELSNEDDGEREQRRGRRRRGGSTDPMFQAVYDAGLLVDGSDPDFTMLDIRPGEPRDLHVLAGGNVTRPGDVAPRGFLSVLANDDPTFQNGSGRLELAERIFSDAAAAGRSRDRQSSVGVALW